MIQDIKVDFANGLTTITGETGAGKSILLGALALLLGKRADMSTVRNSTEKCVVEGEFMIASYNLKRVFKQLAFDYDAHTIIRREILPSGKSRAFVNDSPVNLQELQKLGERLVDIHSQHETRSLLSEKNQLEVLDAVAGNDTILEKYSQHLNEYRRLHSELARLINEKETAAKELDYHEFLFKELEEAQLDTINQESLEETYERLNNAETIKEELAAARQYLLEEQQGAIETAKEARGRLHKLVAFSTEYEGYWERLNSVIIELDDVAEAIATAGETLEADPSQLFEVQERLQTLYKLQQKHTVATVEELREIETDLSTKIATSSTLDDQITMLENSVVSAKEHLVAISEKIREQRLAILPKLKKQLEENLNQLGLPNAQFRFEISPATSFKENGADNLLWLFTANKGAALETMNKVASGGELSRIMLSIKSVLAQYKKLPTLIFDEIDTGVSGEIAQQMATIMEHMGVAMQVISITHLPQIAARGKQQLKVFKEEVENSTTTQLKQLTEEERIVEIAQMIGGHAVTDSAIAHARQLRN